MLCTITYEAGVASYNSSTSGAAATVRRDAHKRLGSMEAHSDGGFFDLFTEMQHVTIVLIQLGFTDEFITDYQSMFPCTEITSFDAAEFVIQQNGNLDAFTAAPTAAKKLQVLGLQPRVADAFIAKVGTYIDHYTLVDWMISHVYRAVENAIPQFKCERGPLHEADEQYRAIPNGKCTGVMRKTDRPMTLAEFRRPVVLDGVQTTVLPDDTSPVTTLYHGTTIAAANHICRYGVSADHGTAAAFSYERAFYVTECLDDAVAWARIVRPVPACRMAVLAFQVPADAYADAHASMPKSYGRRVRHAYKHTEFAYPPSAAWKRVLHSSFCARKNDPISDESCTIHGPMHLKVQDNAYGVPEAIPRTPVKFQHAILCWVCAEVLTRHVRCVNIFTT